MSALLRFALGWIACVLYHRLIRATDPTTTTVERPTPTRRGSRER